MVFQPEPDHPPDTSDLPRLWGSRMESCRAGRNRHPMTVHLGMEARMNEKARVILQRHLARGRTRGERVAPAVERLLPQWPKGIADAKNCRAIAQYGCHAGSYGAP